MYCSSCKLLQVGDGGGGNPLLKHAVGPLSTPLGVGDSADKCHGHFPGTLLSDDTILHDCTSEFFPREPRCRKNYGTPADIFSEENY